MAIMAANDQAQPRRHGHVRRPRPFPASAGVPGSAILPCDLEKAAWTAHPACAFYSMYVSIIT